MIYSGYSSSLRYVTSAVHNWTIMTWQILPQLQISCYSTQMINNGRRQCWSFISCILETKQKCEQAIQLQEKTTSTMHHQERDSLKRYQADRYIMGNHSNSYTCARFQNRTSLLSLPLSLSETAYLSLELSLLEFCWLLKMHLFAEDHGTQWLLLRAPSQMYLLTWICFQATDREVWRKRTAQCAHHWTY